ncbi:MAG: acetate kinase [Clostridia bacterium]|nr:acetate kinase [Clostridia bacterium]
MKILVINAGSSSIKYQLINMADESVIAKGLVERIGSESAVLTHKANGKATEIKKPLKDHAEGLELILKALVEGEIGVIKSLKEISAIGHRVLHGGGKYNKATLVNDSVLRDLKSYIPLGPLHMPANIQGIEACKEVMPDKHNVAVFDTAFHATMPDYAYMYAVPYSWCKDYGIRKYGFHGTSHEFIGKEIALAMGKSPEKLRTISCHLGNGASICAIKYGKCVDTSMGFTPLEGLVMGTRCGDIDPAVVEYAMDKTGMSVNEVINVFNKKSGLLGLSEVSNDMRDVLKSAKEGNEKSKLAIQKFVYAVKKYIGAYAVAMGGVDAIAFSAGTGENRDDIRELVMEDLEFLGIELDKEANRNFTRGVNFKISKDTSKVAVYIIPTDEEMSIARQTKDIL